MLEKIPVSFIKNSQSFPVFALPNESILECAKRNKIPLEGACEGSLACSTCHIIVPKKYFNKLNTPSNREYDMLDLAYDLRDTSRLGCQVKITEECKGMEIEIPKATRNLAVDGYFPKHH